MEADVYHCPTCGAPCEFGIGKGRCGYCGNILFIEDGEVRAQIESLDPTPKELKSVSDFYSTYYSPVPFLERDDYPHIWGISAVMILMAIIGTSILSIPAGEIVFFSVMGAAMYTTLKLLVSSIITIY